MRLRTASRQDEAFDGLTAEDIRRIRGTAAANVTPGLEGLAARLTRGARERQAADEIATKSKRGRRA